MQAPHIAATNSHGVNLPPIPALSTAPRIVGARAVKAIRPAPSPPGYCAAKKIAHASAKSVNSRMQTLNRASSARRESTRQQLDKHWPLPANRALLVCMLMRPARLRAPRAPLGENLQAHQSAGHATVVSFSLPAPRCTPTALCVQLDCTTAIRERSDFRTSI